MYLTRWQEIKNKDAGFPAFSLVVDGESNAEAYFHTILKSGDAEKIEDFLSRMESETNKIKLNQDNHSYALNRKEEYPDIGDQLDAIWKQLNYMRLNGQDLIQECDDMLGGILSIKAKYPKS